MNCLPKLRHTYSGAGLAGYQRILGMALKIEWINTAYLFAVAQALMLVVVIARRRRKGAPEKWLLATLTALALTILHYLLFVNQWLEPTSILMDLGAVSWLSISPLLYLYCRAIVDPELRWQWSYLYYFPLSLYLLSQIVLFSLGLRFGFFLLFEDWNAYNLSWILLYLCNSVAFSLASIRVLRRVIIQRQRKRVEWLVYYFLFFTVVLVVLIGWLLYLLNARQFVRELEFVLLAFYALFIFILVFKSLRYSNYFNDLSNHHYLNEKGDQKTLQLLYSRLEQKMEREEPFRDAALNLKQLADLLEVNENQLSQAFALHNTSFYKFVNHYRLKAFTATLQEQELARFTISGLAEKAGFSSRATFYKVFKSHYGISPSAYLKQKRL